MSKPSDHIMQFFTAEHLKPELKGPATACAMLARSLDEQLPDSPEKTTGLGKLLEAKDCFVRAAMQK